MAGRRLRLRKHKQAYLLLTILGFVGLGTTSLASALETQPVIAPDKEVRIGLVLPLTGNWAFLGQGILNGVTLAVEDSPGSTLPLRVIAEDNGGQLPTSATAAQKLISVDRVDAIISIFSGVSLLITPLAERAQVLAFGICSNTEVPNGSFSFTNYITAHEGAEAFVTELRRRNPTSARLGIVALEEEGFNSIVQQVEDLSKTRSIEIVALDRFRSPTSDFRTQIARLMQKNPNSVLLLGLSPEIELFARQFGELKGKASLVSIESFGLSQDKKAFNGSWFIDAAAPGPEFETRYRSRFGSELTAGVGHAYDTAQILASAFSTLSRNGGKPDRTQVRDYIRNTTEFSGVVGKLTLDKGEPFIPNHQSRRSRMVKHYA